MSCEHSGAHSGAARYERDAAELRLVLVCDECGAERDQLGTIGYRPRGRRLVGHLAGLTARELGLAEAGVGRVRFSAMICDVGRDQIPPEILNKRGPLSEAEWDEVRRQPKLGAALLTDTSFDDIRDWIACRRERPDGRGYPHGLIGDEIPLEAKIIAVVEAYAAMVSDSAHRDSRHHDEAIDEIAGCAGTQFDTDVVAAFVRATALAEAKLETLAA